MEGNQSAVIGNPKSKIQEIGQVKYLLVIYLWGDGLVDRLSLLLLMMMMMLRWIWI